MSLTYVIDLIFTEKNLFLLSHMLFINNIMLFFLRKLSQDAVSVTADTRFYYFTHRRCGIRVGVYFSLYTVVHNYSLEDHTNKVHGGVLIPPIKRTLFVYENRLWFFTNSCHKMLFLYFDLSQDAILCHRWHKTLFLFNLSQDADFIYNKMLLLHHRCCFFAHSCHKILFLH
jgi:hypothetical protein